MPCSLVICSKLKLVSMHSVYGKKEREVRIYMCLYMFIDTFV